MVGENWTISGEYIESCNCEYLCPCIYTNPQGEATDEHCYSLQAYRIDQGQCGDVDLSGLRFAIILRSGRVMSDGGWVYGNVIDESADEAQRAALGAILRGEAGGIPARVHDTVVSDYRGIQFKAIKFVKDGLHHEVDIPGVVSYEVDGVPSRNGNGEPFYIDNTSHPANTRLALARSKYLRVDGFGLELNMSGVGNNGHFAPFSWSG